MLGMVEAGIGIAAVPAMSMPTSEHTLLTHLPLVAPEVKRTVGLIRRRGRIQSILRLNWKSRLPSSIAGRNGDHPRLLDDGACEGGEAR